MRLSLQTQTPATSRRAVLACRPTASATTLPYTGKMRKRGGMRLTNAFGARRSRRFGLSLRRRFRRLGTRSAFVDRDQLGDGHELETFRQQGVEHLGHRLNSWCMDVVREDNGTGARFFNDAICDHVYARLFPIERVNIPEHDVVAKLIMHPLSLPCAHRAVRRSHKFRLHSSQRDDLLL